jgi:hypothetical protein
MGDNRSRKVHRGWHSQCGDRLHASFVMQSQHCGPRESGKMNLEQDDLISDGMLDPRVVDLIKVPNLEIPRYLNFRYSPCWNRDCQCINRMMVLSITLGT